MGGPQRLSSLDPSGASPSASGTVYRTSWRHRPAATNGVRGLLADAGATLAYLAAAVTVTLNLWAAPGERTVLGPGGADLMQFEMFMEHGARVVTDLQNPFFTSQVNAPLGVNMMANTSVLGLSIPLAPVTLLFGGFTSVLVALVLGLGGTATAWYWVLSRHVTSRGGAFVGGAFCGFAPGMVSQATGHVNFVSGFLLPFIAVWVARLGEPGRVLRNGLVLGVLATWQVFINEEMLLLTAAGCLMFVIVWALANPALARARARNFLAGLAVAALVAGAAVAYPLTVQFLGPQSYTTLPFDPTRFHADAHSYLVFASESLAGDADVAEAYARNPSEENTFLGWPLMLVLPVLMVWFWRITVARAATIIAVIFGALALGETVMLEGRDTGIPGPYRYLAGLPLFDLTLPSRYALVAIPMVGLLLALAASRVGRLPRAWPRVAGSLVLAAALLPILPTPLQTRPTPAVPEFIATGAWRAYLAGGGTLVPVPLPKSRDWNEAALRWTSVTGMDARMPGGYFIGPNGPTDRAGRFGASPRPTSDLWDRVARTGIAPNVDEADREAAIADRCYWQAAVVVLGPHPHEAALKATTDALFGPGTRVDDVWLWPGCDAA